MCRLGRFGRPSNPQWSWFRRVARQFLLVGSQGSLRMRLLMPGCIVPSIAHDFVNALPRPVCTYLKKASLVFGLEKA
jgi:hypothetical protein